MKALNATGNKLYLLIVPVLVIALGFIGTPYLNKLPIEVIEKFPYLPYLFLTAAILLGGFFKRHRVTLNAVSLAIGFVILHNFALHPDRSATDMLYLSFVGVLLPLNVAVLSGLKEQQILSVQGVIITTLLLAQVLLGFWSIQNYATSLGEWLTYQPTWLAGLLPATIPISVLVSFILSMMIMIVHMINKPSVFEVTFTGMLAAAFCYFFTGMQTEVDTIFVSIAALLLLWGLIHNSYLIAYIDELTELPGRRALNEELNRLRGNYSIAMLDIDHFKKFNDTYGHDVGDQVLRMVASKISQIGGNGKPFRYGGEEFAIVFSGRDSKSAFPYLSTLRESVDDTSLILRQKDRPSKKPEKIPPRKVPWQEVHVTISIGVANSCEELPGSEEVIKAADQALYRSKEKGRNRITQYSTKVYDPGIGSAAPE